MINQLSYFYFKKALPENLCNEIIRFGNSKIKHRGITGYEIVKKNSIKKKLSQGDKKKINKIRKSNITWVNEPWITREVTPYLYRANKEAGWNYDIEGHEQIQFTEYNKGQFYNFHQDYFDGPDKDGKYRKVSMTINLSDPKEYKGGDLFFKSLDKEKNILIEHTNPDFKEKGTICAFPSFEIHKVSPVTQGIRHSLVLWSYGKAFQ